MHPREAVLATIAELKAHPEAGRSEAWSTRIRSLVDEANVSDREWAADRVQDLLFQLGLSPNDAETERVLASRGMICWDDDQPGEPTAWHQRYFVDGFANALSPGGSGPFTWGPCRDNERAIWLSIASAPPSPFEMERGHSLLDEHLSACGLSRQ